MGISLSRRPNRKKNLINSATYCGNSQPVKTSASKGRKSKEQNKVNAAKIVEQFKKFNFNYESFNRVVLNAKKTGSKQAMREYMSKFAED